MENKKTAWKYFKDGYKYTSLAFILIFLTSLTMSLIRHDELWYFSFFFLFIGVVAIPVGSYLLWRQESND